MRYFLIILAMLIGLGVPTMADEAKQSNYPSASGIIEDAHYEDADDIPDKSNLKNTKQTVVVRVTSGKFKGAKRIVDNMLTGNPAYDINLSKGDRVILHVEALSEIVATDEDVNFYIADVKRDDSLLLYAGIFFTLLLIIGRKKGLSALVSIVATTGLIFAVLVPMILNGLCPIASASFVAALSTLITIYLVGGLNSKSTAAVLGVIFSLVMVAILSMGAIALSSLTGFNGEEPMFLYSARPDLDFRGILSASMIIAALGALMDTGISIASTINEIYETDNSLTIKQLFTSGMNVGKDIIGTMSNTLILVYLGASLPLALLSSNIDLNKFFNLNQVATEIASALVGSIGILACVPITAIITAYLIKRRDTAEFEFPEVEQSEE